MIIYIVYTQHVYYIYINQYPITISSKKMLHCHIVKCIVKNLSIASFLLGIGIPSVLYGCQQLVVAKSAPVYRKCVWITALFVFYQFG